MSQALWDAVDGYINGQLVPQDAALEACLRESSAAGLPEIQVTPNQGKLLGMLARMVGARRVLEIGTLGGYSTIWLARNVVAGGRVVTVEFEPRHAAVAKSNIERAGLASVVDVRVGKALEVIPTITDAGPFDLFFIDADKENNAEYFAWAVRLSRPGSVIVIDNVVRDGAIVEESSADPRVQGVRRMYEAMAREARVEATAVQTVGSKGYDGFAVAVVTV